MPQAKTQRDYACRRHLDLAEQARGLPSAARGRTPRLADRRNNRACGQRDRLTEEPHSGSRSLDEGRLTFRREATSSLVIRPRSNRTSTKGAQTDRRQSICCIVAPPAQGPGFDCQKRNEGRFGPSPPSAVRLLRPHSCDERFEREGRGLSTPGPCFTLASPVACSKRNRAGLGTQQLRPSLHAHTPAAKAHYPPAAGASLIHIFDPPLPVSADPSAISPVRI